MSNGKTLLTVILFSVFVSGCAPTILNIGLIEAGRINAIEEFYIDNYKMRLRIIPIGNDEYICSFLLSDKNDGTPIKDVKSVMDIKMYSNYPKTHYRHRHEKKTIFSGLEPIVDSASNDYDYKYKLTGKGKYELTIKLNEVAGKELDKEIYISFDQEAK
ncbi:MAG: hypothetical protein HRF52_11885 [Ignavibacterium sp.]|uniref:hypothetical protein n=1 Tax=Ignavibacterium sp. TaxID=2651167 RepID=UPI0032988C62